MVTGFHYKELYFSASCVWVWNLVSHILGNIWVESVWEQGAYEAVWMYRGGVTGGWKILHNEELHDLYFWRDIMRMIKSGMMRQVERVTHMYENCMSGCGRETWRKETINNGDCGKKLHIFIVTLPLLQQKHPTMVAYLCHHLTASHSVKQCRSHSLLVPPHLLLHLLT